MNRFILAIAAIATIAGTMASASAGSLGRPCTQATQDRWLPVDALREKIEAQGYVVQKAKIAKACGEFYVRDRQGNRAELFVDPTDATIVGRQ